MCVCMWERAHVRVYVLYMKNKTTCHVCRKKISWRHSLLAVGKELFALGEALHCLFQALLGLSVSLIPEVHESRCGMYVCMCVCMYVCVHS